MQRISLTATYPVRLNGGPVSQRSHLHAPRDSFSLRFGNKESRIERDKLRRLTRKLRRELKLEFSKPPQVITTAQDLIEAYNNRAFNKSIKVEIPRAQLAHQSLGGALLNFAELPNANFSNAECDYIKLEGANLEKANFSNANLSEAKLNDAHLVKANLSGANLQGAELARSICTNAIFSKAKLAGADFDNADLSHADFSDATFDKTAFLFTNLAGAKFPQANLQTCFMGNNDISGTDFTGAQLPEEGLFGSRYEQRNPPKGIDALLSQFHIEKKQFGDEFYHVILGPKEPDHRSHL